VDYLILTPPICTPAEPAAGAFTLAAGLAGRGLEVGLLDLSLEMIHRTLRDPEIPGPEVARALDYLVNTSKGYEPQQHRSSTGLLHARLKGFGKRWPGWTMTLMDLAAPGRVHDPVALSAALARGTNPFASLWDEVLGPVLDRERPREVLISLAYLSQLAAAIDLASVLRARGLEPLVGGSLPNSLAHSGRGLQALRGCFPRMTVGDGLALLPDHGATEHLTDRLAWPPLLSPRPYLSARPVVPIPLSTGCYWDRCAFCPDRGLPWVPVPPQALDHLFSGAPDEIRVARPLVHLLDSALAPAQLRRFLPIAQDHGLSFYGFARPSRHLTPALIDEAAAAGCAMLQLGAEGGSEALLSRYDKGFAPKEAEEVIGTAAAAGIRTYLYLLFGLPHETHDDRRLTLEFLTRDAEAVDFLNLSVFNLPEQSSLTQEGADHGIELGAFPDDGAIRLYRPFLVDGVDPRAEARAFLERELRSHPLVRPMVRRSPRWLRAAHNAMLQVPGRS
jgi:hypothetical protein